MRRLLTGRAKIEPELRPTPSTVIDRGPMGTLHRYPQQQPSGAPILLVPPLAAPASCYDLRRGCSLVEFLLDAGHPVYLVDYGDVSYADRDAGIERWIEGILPRAVERVAQDVGEPPHLVGWSMGGQLSVLTAAHRTDLPIASVTAVASPFDYTKIPVLAVLRCVNRLVPRPLADIPFRLLGGVPSTLVRRGFQLSGLDRHLLRPLVELSNMDDHEFLAHLVSVDKFTAAMTAYPGRTFLQIYHDYFRSNALATGVVDLAGRRISVGKVDVPVLIVSGTSDLFSPPPASEHLAKLLTGAPRVQIERVPGGHLGVITGRGARATTWTHLAGFLAGQAAA